jgi:type I restriction enzyme S subunit
MENNTLKKWVETPLEDLIVHILGGDWGTDLKESFSDEFEKVKVVRGTDYKEWNTKRACNAPVRLAKKSSVEKRKLLLGDIVVEVSGGGPDQPVGRTIIIDEVALSESLPLLCSNFFRQIRLSGNLNPFFVNYFLTHAYYKGLFNEYQTQTTNIRNLNVNDFVSKTIIPLPPSKEQDRIVLKLDAAFSKIEANQRRLEKIPKLLKRFRQSVLASSVREFGEDEIIDNVCEEIQIGPFGTQLHKHDYISNGIPLVNPTHIQGGEIVPDMDLTISKKKFNELSNYHLKVGDVIMGRRGEMARCALVGEKENNWLCGTGSLFFRPNLKKIDPKFLFWILSNSNTKTFLEAEAKGSTMNNLNLSIVKNIPFSLPSLKEQKAIIKKAEKLFSIADKIEMKYSKAKKMLDKLPQSLLAKAFRGDLVPQDPNDESAEELLERIREEKEKLKSEGKKSKVKVQNKKTEKGKSKKRKPALA